MKKREKIHVVFLLPSLAAGGAERILSFIAQHLDTEKFEPVLLITGFEHDTVYIIKNVNVVYLNKTRVSKAATSLFSYFKKEKPDIVISSIVHLNTLTALLSIFFPKIKFIAREANVLSVLEKHNPIKTSIFPKFLVVFAYKLVDRILCQSKDMQHDMLSNYGVSKEKTVLINNPITQAQTPKQNARQSQDILKFITVGRLSKEKGHDRIITLLSKLKFSFHYTMIGDGNQKENILALIKSNGLTEHVTQISYTNEVNRYLSESDVFIQGSYSEGFPNALIESCVVGTPIMAFKAPGGIDEIIEDGKNGYIHESIDDVLNCLNQLNDEFNFDPKIVASIVNERFNKETIIDKYQSLFYELMSPK